ncbi:integrase [Paramagnetospirillum marisnigri]|jgi:DNA invertase Pin-like site-specific DNA recombinase|uniref:Integrase n=1 Tax=Paramagnetospirillum marisnigri TaxID=1285242 RepID=A0A178MKK4_9PROT|nr:recombinase family protein [Paramagnetospirillum marisnigri]OAN48667.1 integrase [Paramagnetospirillum marisnigri]
MLYGYARCSSADQSLDIQIDALKAAGCQIIRSEKISGTSRDGRRELETLLEFLREGDVLVVTRIDRLARSISDLQDIIKVLKGKGASLKATEQPFDTGDIYGTLTINLLGVFAQFETELRRERQIEGIQRAMQDHPERYRGRPPKIDAGEIRRLKDQGFGVAAISRELGIARTSVYRALDVIS